MSKQYDLHKTLFGEIVFDDDFHKTKTAHTYYLQLFSLLGVGGLEVSEHCTVIDEKHLAGEHELFALLRIQRCR